jgi:uridine kinase
MFCAIDGPSGAGKSSLARCLAARCDADVFHMDDIYVGWEGLAEGARFLVDAVLSPLSESRPARWHRFDWASGGFAEEHTTFPGRFLIVEGVGSYSQRSAPFLDFCVWLDAPEARRRLRVEGRDGSASVAHWDVWAAQETEFHLREQTRAGGPLRPARLRGPTHWPEWN